VNKEILRLAIPNILSNIAIPLLGLVDLTLMGHLGSEKYIGAIALGTMIFNFLYWGFAFLRMGTSGFTAQAVGRKDEKETSLLLYRSMSIAIIGGALIIFFQFPIEWLAMKLISGGEEVENLTRYYFSIRIWAAPATIAMFSLSGWFIGMQNAWIPMIISIVVNIANIALSMFFILVLGMTVEGVALGTVISQYLGLLLGIFFIWKKYRNSLICFNIPQVFESKELRRFMSVNSDIFFRTACVILTFTFFTSKSAATNDLILAANSLMLQFLMFFSYLIDGFAYAGEALVGKSIGEKSKQNLISVVKKLFAWGAGVAFLFSLIYIFGGEGILRLLTSEESVIVTSRAYMKWVWLVPILSVSSFVWDGVYIGATASKAMRNTLISSTFLFFFPLYFLLNSQLGNHALWIALLAFMGSRGLVQTFLAGKAVFSQLD